MQDAWRAYLELALGLTEAPRKRAQDAARRPCRTAAARPPRNCRRSAEELLSTGAANREALTKLVRFEWASTGRSARCGLAKTADEVAELTPRVRDLERQLREAEPRAGPQRAAGRPRSASGPLSRRPHAAAPPTLAGQPGTGWCHSDGPAGAPHTAPRARNRGQEGGREEGGRQEGGVGEEPSTGDGSAPPSATRPDRPRRPAPADGTPEVP